MKAETGPIGGDLSHEFVILADTGESKIYTDKRIFNVPIDKYKNDESSLKKMRNDFSKFYAVTDNKFKAEDFDKNVRKSDQLQTKGIEVGHIFYFGDKYSKSMNCSVDSKDGKKTFVKMGSYGIGVSRLVAAIIEAKYVNEKMKWPISVSPFDVVIIPAVNKNDKSNMIKALKIYKELKKKGIDVLLDDADDNIANKFKKHDLLGIPFQIIVGSKATKDKFEFKEVDKKSQMLNLNKIIKLLKN
jgi:prolyl-tRNA synthetase